MCVSYNQILQKYTTVHSDILCYSLLWFFNKVHVYEIYIICLIYPIWNIKSMADSIQYLSSVVLPMGVSPLYQMLLLLSISSLEWNGHTRCRSQLSIPEIMSSNTLTFGGPKMTYMSFMELLQWIRHLQGFWQDSYQVAPLFKVEFEVLYHNFQTFNSTFD